MSFRSSGIRPAVFRSAAILLLTLSATVAIAQGAPPKTTAPVAAASAAKPASAASTAPTPAAATSTAAAASAPVAEVAVKPGDASAGQAKAAVCGACHGLDGNSSIPLYPKLAGQSEQYIVHQLNNFKSGKRQNPIMLGMATPLSEQDMQDIAAYFASQKTVPGVADQALVGRGELLFRQGDPQHDVPACMACHAMDGSGNPGSMYPHLAGQHAQYVQATLKAWHDGTSWGTNAHARIMPTIAKHLDDADIAALASYLEGLHSADTAPAAAP